MESPSQDSHFTLVVLHNDDLFYSRCSLVEDRLYLHARDYLLGLEGTDTLSEKAQVQLRKLKDVSALKEFFEKDRLRPTGKAVLEPDFAIQNRKEVGKGYGYHPYVVTVFEEELL